MIKESVKKFGDYSLEIKFKYRPKPKTKFHIHGKYSVDIYFFLPWSMGVNKKNYTKKDFYREINSYIKVDPIKVLLSELVKEDNDISLQLKKAFKNLGGEEEDSMEKMESLMKVYLSIVKKAVKRELRSINKAGQEKEKYRLSYRLIKNFGKLVLFFRSLENYLPQSNNTNEEANKIFRYGNEYLSTIYIKYLYIVFQIFEESKSVKKYSAEQQISEEITKEQDYRNAHEFPLITPKNFSKDNEKLLYRWGALTNYINDKLIITSRFEKENKWLIQFYYSIAAGIAMIFATSIAFYYNQVFGNFTIRFFVVLVVSYMFKDRIKDWIKELINYLLKKETYDHTINIYDENEQRIGNIAQGFSFIPKKALSKEIINARMYNLENEIEDHSFERIMHYKGKTKIKISKLFNMFNNIKIRGVNDVIYFNTSPLLMRMEGPETDIMFLNNKGKLEKYKSEKVHHINMILKYQHSKRIEISKYRIVLNRNGIKKVEKVI